MKMLLSVLMMLSLAAGVIAQKTGVVSETMTVTNSVTTFAANTVAELTQPAAECVGVLETAEIRMTFDGTTPTTTVGMLLVVGQEVTVRGLGNIKAFKAIRTTGTSGSLFWTCSE